MIYLGAAAYAAIGLYFFGRTWRVIDDRFSALAFAFLFSMFWPLTIFVSAGLHSVGAKKQMWEVKYDRWAEKWIVCEYTRSDEGLFWKTEADALAEMKNRRLHQQPTSSRSEFTEYDVYEPTDVWPGGFVSYGSSMG